MTQGMEPAIDVQMTDVQIVAVQSDLQPPSERVAYRAALQVVPTALSAMVAVPTEVENGQPMQIDLPTPRACQAEPQGSAQAPDPEAVFTWSEEKLGDANDQAPPAGPEAEDVHKTQEAVATSHALPSPVDQAT